MLDPRFTVHGARRLLDSGSIRSRELVEFFLQRIDRWNEPIRAMISVDRDAALEAADRCDALRARGESVPPLCGIPIGLKDILCTRSSPTTCGSRMLEHYVSPFDAHVVSQLQQSGAILIGKTNLDEFAMGGSTETSIFGPSRNPWDNERTCGGSSGGSAAAVAAGFASAAIGTDTGGSIRQPAAFCGVCGLKPTYGRVSRYGLIAYGSSLDVAGVFAHDLQDAAILLQAIAGHDARDSTSLVANVPDYAAAMTDSRQPLRIGRIREHLDSEGLHPEIRQGIESAIEVFRSAGAKIVDISLPHSKYCIPAYYIIAPCEASSNLARYDGAHYGFRAAASRSGAKVATLDAMYEATRSEGFGPEVRRRILLGTYALSAGYYDAYYLKALKVRRMIRNDYDAAFEQVDLLIGPTTPNPAFRLGEKLNDPVQLYLEDLFTVGANLAGIPALSIPLGCTRDGLPIGMQLQAPALQEGMLLAAGHRYHTSIGYEPSIPAPYGVQA
ncbi:MAG: Asp-tRNA(Asn)/Glu-tRNA(Gln) amidotransferase subunit GatA [Planctomycetota bacterium]|jgi:aspartyl-tRNA(Asn)/glutamyl-tRNA(Gln) amidotransferase subunit A